MLLLGSLKSCVWRIPNAVGAGEGVRPSAQPLSRFMRCDAGTQLRSDEVGASRSW